jgi:hypothetical protein
MLFLEITSSLKKFDLRISFLIKLTTEFFVNKSIMSHEDECQTPPTRRVSTDHQPDTKRSNGRCLWHEQEAGPPMTPFMTPPKYSDRADRYDVDRGVETDAKKMRLSANKTSSKNRSRRSANRRNSVPTSETDTLRSELAAVHKTYHEALRQKDDEIKSLKGHLLTISNLAVRDIDSLNNELNDLKDDLDITEGELTIFQKSEKEWIGRALKLKFILDEIKKIGALPDDHAEWVDPMVEEIEIPEVSINIKDEFVPTAQTDNIDWVSSEEEEEEEEYETFHEGQEDIIGEYLENETSTDLTTDLTTPENCSNCGEMTHATWACTMPQGFMLEHEPYGSTITDDPTNREVDEHGTMMNVFVPRIDYSYPRAVLEKSATTIQKAWQNHQILKKEKLDRELDDFMYCRRLFNKWEWDSDGLHDDLATVIQRVWRGHHLRKLLAVASKDRLHQDRETMREEAYFAQRHLYYAGYHFPAEKL